MHNRFWAILIGLLISSTALAIEQPYRFGLSLSLPVVTKDPSDLYAYRIAATYAPAALTWERTQIYFDLSAGHWWVTNSSQYHSLNIYALAPVLRYYFKVNSQYFSPFINLSIGPAYLSRTRLDGQNLGMHFSFQDELGIGTLLGSHKQWSAILSGLHYSNGSLCGSNAGITVPLVFTIGYRF